MQLHERLDAKLKEFYDIHFNKEFLVDDGSISYIDYSPAEIDYENYFELEQLLTKSKYLELVRSNDIESYFRITKKGIKFYEDGGYTKIYNNETQRGNLKQQEEQRIQELDSAAKQATIDQAEIAKEALDESRKARQIAQNALWVS